MLFRSRVDGRKLEVIPVDHALMGVVAPAGEREMLLEYHSTYFLLGALVTLLSTAVCVAAVCVFATAAKRQRVNAGRA